MPIESAADRATFFDGDEFALAASYTLAAGGAPSTVNGIFDNEFLAVDQASGVALSSQDPRLQCAVADLPGGYGSGDTLVIEAVTYKARDFEPDGTGLVFIVLEKQ